MKNGKSNILPFLAALAVVLVWAETFVSSKILIGAGLRPADIFSVRFALAYLLMIPFAGRRLLCESVKDELLMALLGITGGSLYFLMENSALVYAGASDVSIIVCGAPLVTALLISIFYREERLTPLQVLGSVIAMIGVALVVLNGNLVLKFSPLGDILAFGAALTWGFYSLLMRKVEGRYDVRFTTRKVFFYGLITILPWYAVNGLPELDAAVLAKPAVWGNLLYLGTIASFVCFLTWNWCLGRLGTVLTTNIIYFQPFFTMMVAALILGERITWMAILGTVILTGGMILASRNGSRARD